MAGGNQTAVVEFILLGLTSDPVAQVILFGLFLVTYTVTLLGNCSIILLIRIHSHLHTPMYFLLSHLSFTDMCISSTATPKLLENSLMGKTSISYMECAVQFFIASIFGPAECLLLAAMAYDRYVAICKPLAYPAIMSKRFCLLMVVDSYLGSLLTAFVFTSNLFRLSFCGPNVINHFFCDFPPLLKLSCSDTTLAKIIPSSFATLLILSTLAIIVVSYLYIMLAILRIKSSAGRGKAFSTCASHLTAVSLFYGSSAFIYMLPKSKYSMDQKKVVSMFYMVVIPMLNPLIYTLRNKEVKEALKRTLGIKGIYYGQF